MAGRRLYETHSNLKAMAKENQQLEDRAEHVGVVLHPWPRLLDVPHLAAYVGLAEQTIRNHANEIPGRRRFGKKIVWDRLIIDDWITKNHSARDLWVDARRLAG